MDNLALYHLLISQVSEFNKWRIAHPSIRVDFSGMDFRGKQLSDALLVNCDLKKADFQDACIEYACFSNSSLQKANFNLAAASGAQFGKLEVIDTHLPSEFTRHLKKPARLDSANFASADLSYTNFRDVSLKNTCFRSANLSYAHFSDVKFEDTADFCEANLQQTIFWKTEEIE